MAGSSSEGPRTLASFAGVLAPASWLPPGFRVMNSTFWGDHGKKEWKKEWLLYNYWYIITSNY